MQNLKDKIKIAQAIQQATLYLQKQRYVQFLKALRHLTDQLQQLARQSRKLGLALDHNWFFASAVCSSRIGRLLYEISYTVSRLQHQADRPESQLPGMKALLEELSQIQQEFCHVGFDNGEQLLSVTTEPIVLDGVYLGPFEIQLSLDKLCELYREPAYRVIALEPHPAASAEEITHPHVTNDQLCEGDGYAAITAALEQGRLCDFFNLVSSILNTYNPDSPYVRLDDWRGVACCGCGYVTDDDDIFMCSFCSNQFCGDCCTYCRSCDESICNSCAKECQICQEPTCRNCAAKCTQCGLVCCPSCLEECLCVNCKHESEVEHETKKQKEAIEAVQTAAQEKNTAIEQ